MATMNSLPVKFDDITACSKILYAGIEGGEFIVICGGLTAS